jgi:hypothetical protein
VKVSTVKDVAYLMRLLSLTGLSREKGQWYRTSRDEYGAVEFHIVEPRWFSYFDREYWSVTRERH